MDQSTHEKKGYLNQNFRLFHLKDQIEQSFANHYHEFDKIVIFLSGNVTYLIEGKSYFLKPWDILLVNHHDIHKPVIDPTLPYERIIIWVNQDFLNKMEGENYNLSSCFLHTSEKGFSLLRSERKVQNHIETLLKDLESSLSSTSFASDLMSDTIFLQFLIYINRIILEDKVTFSPSSYHYDEKIEKVIHYINSNLENDLSIGTIANEMFLSKYYLMHKFKEETGYTVHNYILQKRLLRAADLIKKDTPVTEACLKCGFQDYSTFLRGFKKLFHKTPSEY